ncbi:UDP-N-acetylmuramoyl-L-alanine--D-glutamate ligase [Helicobacter anatolicus]|uniref:UDP-N-acetylmuramoyl-L-alanine--D-glutamate ligase n=1 Tax=Helicobacter anatolicus TaxID=2905874 RepID=UPI001E2882BB|nr:UDP-N-acetylmuramoyl-L-alanine--D-glutamate ligase [Helicobacter anatolicus]MCE3038585.1 UDP-N-acetylmuramoyl-L-alanine--D-glutamate ligase [Helicobacter anatolicus]
MKKVSLLGYGTTTEAIAEFLNQNGVDCDIFDDYCKEVKQENKKTFYPSRFFETKDSVIEITSPGIPPSHPMIRKAKNLYSEYDFFFDYFKDKSIWISGTNGKTTTTQMLEFLLQKVGGKSGGNIGYPLAKLAQENPKIWILETSSFTLHYTKKAYPKYYILLPVKEDHIHWHGDFQGYIKDKLSPLLQMQKDGIAFVPANFQTFEECKQSLATIIYYEDENDLAKNFNFSLKKSIFKPPFLLDAVLAFCMARFFDKNISLESLNAFLLGAHRLQEFLDSFGRLWVDDSKGTNVDATCEAIKRYQDRKIHLILGGDDKGANHKELFTLMQNKDIILYLIGSNAKKLENIAQDFGVESKMCGVMEKAVLMIKSCLQKNEVALLSPAAASLDQFKSYKERGELFQKLALE